jgi:hypothetical protein
MKHLLLALAAVAMLVTAIAPANASCPAGSKYQCYPSGNGKMQCGCF